MHNHFMQPVSISLGIVTASLAECREFYVRHFGFQTVKDLAWYVHLRSPGGGCDLGFVAPDRPELDSVFHRPLAGEGVYVGIEVADVEQALRDLSSSGIPILAPLRDEPWGERHFVVRDPAGCLVNVWQRKS